MDLNLAISIGGVVMSSGIAWGIASSRIRTLEVQVALLDKQTREQQDILVEIRTKVDLLLKGRIK